MTMLRKTLTGAAAGLILVLASSALAAVPCTANVRAKERTDQVFSTYKTKVYAVEIDTQQDCAKVYVDFTVTETLFNGEEITSTFRDWRKATGGLTTTYMVNHRIALDSKVTDWNFKVNRCVVCGTE